MSPGVSPAPAVVGVGSVFVDRVGLGTVFALSKAAETRSCSLGEEVRGSGTLAVGEGDFRSPEAAGGSWAGTWPRGVGVSFDGVAVVSSVVVVGRAAPSASAVRDLRDRPNAFRKRVRMPMCAQPFA